MKLLKKSIDKYKCKWIEPWEGAPWEYQECRCPEIFDVSCVHQANAGPDIGKDYTCFEEKGKK